MAKGKKLKFYFYNNNVILNHVNFIFREYLQSLNINDGPKLLPRTLFKNNKQIIRSSWYDTDVS